jgi:hypothetical protein
MANNGYRDELAEQEAENTRRRFAARAQRAGMPVANADDDDDFVEDDDDDLIANRPQRRKAQAAPKKKELIETDNYFEIDASGDEVEIKMFLKGGQEVDFTIPPMTMERINMLGWHQNRVNKFQQDLLNTNSAEKAVRMADRVKGRQEKLVIYMIPSFPIGLFGKLPAVAFKRLMDRLNEMSADALEMETDADDDDPND